VPGASRAGAWPTKHSLLTTNYEPKSPYRRASDRSDEKIVIVRGALNKNYGIEFSSLEKDQGIAKPTSFTAGRSFKPAGAVKRVAKHAKTSSAQIQSLAPAPPAAPTLTLEERLGSKMGM
jgi:hypothetical protein